MYPLINPATGLLMLSDGPYGFDIGGNPYGSDLSSSTCWDSDISACGSSDW
ncbi:MAG: peptidase [Rhodocyclaceae bacterium]|nr:peptidase [Rhodocyclaceae bacterium]